MIFYSNNKQIKVYQMPEIIKSAQKSMYVQTRTRIED